MPPRTAKRHFHTDKSASHQPSIDIRTIVILLVIIGCVVFLWSYMTRTAEESKAASPEKQIITRPTESNR